MHTGKHTTPPLPPLLAPEQWRECDEVVKKESLLVHVGSEESYQSCHIQGAVWLAPEQLMDGTPPAMGKIPSTQRLSKALSQIGLNKQRHVVAYDCEGGGWAGRFIWTLDVLGHSSWSYLDGGLSAWQAAGFDCDQTLTPTGAGDYSAEITQRPYLSGLEDVMTALKNNDAVIWDARSGEEYNGERVFAKRGGHIPGAIHYEWLRLMDGKRGLRLRALEELRSELTQAGIIKDNTPIITHCQSHHRSGLTYLVGRLLELDISGYHGSWSEWGNRDDTPIE